MKIKRAIAMILAMLMLLGAISALAESAVINRNTRVYQKASTSSASIKVKKGLTVELLATRGAWALVECGGVRAFMNKAHLSAEVKAPDYSDLMENAIEAQFTANSRVYQKPSTASASIRVPKGMKVNLLAVSGSWALVENNGVYAYAKTKYLTEISTTPNLERPVTMYINADTKVYKKASTSSASLKVPKGMKVTRLSGQGNWALIQNGNAKAYIQNKYLSETDEFLVEATPTPAPTATPKPDYSALLKDAKDGVFTKDGKVYESADTSSASVSVSKGTKVKLLAVNGGWALIAKGDAYGFTDEDNVSLIPEATATPTPTPKPTATPTPVPENYLTSSKYTNEQKCHMFMVREMNLNCAAACGILANMRKESNFNPTAGSSYYGLIQWGGGRLTNLKKFCSNNGYSYSTLEGQLNFLSYELEKSYSSVLKYLKAVPDTAQGAYDAAYHFCYYYERPANKASSSASRGELAQGTYYPKYA